MKKVSENKKNIKPMLQVINVEWSCGSKKKIVLLFGLVIYKSSTACMP